MHDPALRPQNLRRSALHAGSGLLALLVIQALPTRGALVGVAGGLALAAWTMEISRRASPRVNDVLMWIFGPVAHAHERTRVNSATWYATALLMIALAAPPVVCAVAVVVLAFGDPMAAWVGRRWGAHRIVNGRSIEGSVAFVVAAAATTFGALRLCFPEIDTPTVLGMALAGAVAGAIAELLARRVDDNFSIPVAAAAASALLLAAR